MSGSAIIEAIQSYKDKYAWDTKLNPASVDKGLVLVAKPAPLELPVSGGFALDIGGQEDANS